MAEGAVLGCACFVDVEIKATLTHNFYPATLSTIVQPSGIGLASPLIKWSANRPQLLLLVIANE